MHQMTVLHKLLREGNILIRGIIDERFPHLELIMAASPKSKEGEDYRAVVLILQFDLPLGKKPYIGFDPLNPNFQIAYERHLRKCDWMSNGEVVPTLFSKRKQPEHEFISADYPTIREALYYTLGFLQFSPTDADATYREMNEVLALQLADFLASSNVVAPIPSN